MKPFRFQQFTVFQNSKVFRIGTDAVLLGSLASCHGNKMLEVGTGTGVISMMMAQRNPKLQITALDIDEEAVLLAKENFSSSPFAERLEVLEADFKNFSAGGKFSQIVSNPPYFKPNTSGKDVLARQRRELEFVHLIRKSAEILEPAGVLSVIIPSAAASDFISQSEGCGLFLIRKIDIFGIENGPLKRNILEFSTDFQPRVIEKFTIEKSPRNYSDQYLELTKKFHVFSG